MKPAVLCLMVLLFFGLEARAQCPGGKCPTVRAILRVPVVVAVVPAAPAVAACAPVAVCSPVAVDTTRVVVRPLGAAINPIRRVAGRLAAGIENRRELRQERRATRR